MKHVVIKKENLVTEKLLNFLVKMVEIKQIYKEVIWVIEIIVLKILKDFKLLINLFLVLVILKNSTKEIKRVLYWRLKNLFNQQLKKRIWVKEIKDFKEELH